MNSDGERSHLSTIRRSRPSYLSNKDSFGENERNERDSSSNNSSNNQMMNPVFVKKPGGGGIYASLGRKVAAPVIRSNSIEKEKMEIKKEMEKMDTKSGEDVDKIILTTEKSAIEKEIDQVGGYKPFNPYLNRPLTFSTFRPGNNATAAATATNNNPSTVAISNGNLTSVLTNIKPISVSATSKR
jgi:hypothetical protein